MKRLLISFSGGRTSGYMTYRALREISPHYNETVVLFANTGQEDPRTLDFVNRCDEEFGFNTIWLEAEVSPLRGRGTGHRVVGYNTASRSGRPFEEVVQKYGVPNRAAPHCTRELKLRPMRSYVRSIGWKAGGYDQLVGIRADEIDRMSPSAKENRIRYPLIGWDITKKDVLSWWASQSFDLYLPEHYGNCVWCWKKSRRKLLTLAKESPEVFEFPRRMERLYGGKGALANKTGERQVFFRSRSSADDIIAASRDTDFSIFEDPNYVEEYNACSESCEVEYV